MESGVPPPYRCRPAERTREYPAYPTCTTVRPPGLSHAGSPCPLHIPMATLTRLRAHLVARVCCRPLGGCSGVGGIRSVSGATAFGASAIRPRDCDVDGLSTSMHVAPPYAGASSLRREDAAHDTVGINGVVKVFNHKRGCQSISLVLRQHRMPTSGSLIVRWHSRVPCSFGFIQAHEDLADNILGFKPRYFVHYTEIRMEVARSCARGRLPHMGACPHTGVHSVIDSFVHLPLICAGSQSADTRTACAVYASRPTGRVRYFVATFSRLMQKFGLLCRRLAHGMIATNVVPECASAASCVLVCPMPPHGVPRSTDLRRPAAASVAL